MPNRLSYRSRLLVRWCVFVLCVTSAGCGYQFGVEGAGPVIGGSADRTVQGPPVRLAIHRLKNNSFQPAIEFKYTGYLRRTLGSGGAAEIVEDERSADYILDGAIISVSFPSLAFSETQTQASRVQVNVSVKVKERKTGKVRWSQAGIGTAEYYVGATATGDAETGLQFNRVLQDRAIEQAGMLVAMDLADGFLIARDKGKFQKEEKEESMSDSATFKKDVKSPESLELSNELLPTSDQPN
jgi:lipopolysaccharide assembly LptE-like protein